MKKISDSTSLRSKTGENDKISIGCSSVKVTLDVMGGKWKPLIMFLLASDTMRFGQIQRSIDSITQKMLTQQLRELEDDGLIRRKVYPVVPPKVEYSITDYGKTLIPVLRQMHEWGRAHRKKNGLKREIPRLKADLRVSV